MMAEAATVEGIMRNRTLVGVENGCRYYVPPGRPPSDRGASYPSCHWYLEANVTIPWAAQVGLPGAGSEFAWDTTGQEEAYVWGDWFSSESRPAAALAASALDQILAYTPLVPNWAWHGSAFGMGDFGNNGFYRGSGRVLQHYRSGLNSIPSTEAFLADPSDLYLLRLAAGSISGVLTNIDEDGAPAMAFHGDPKIMTFDPASGDHGLAFYGHSHNTQSFLVTHPVFGQLCYFCDLIPGAAGVVTIAPRDTYRRPIFIAELGLQLRSDAGTIAEAEVDVAEKTVTLHFDAVGAQPLSEFRFRALCRSPALCAAGVDTYAPVGLVKTRGGYAVKPAASGYTTVVIAVK